MALEPGTKIDNWIILRSLGQGMWGRVYKAFDRKRDEVIALKMLPEPADPKVSARIRRESEVAREVHHEGLVSSRGQIREVDDLILIPMEFVEGVTLESLLSSLQEWNKLVRHGLAVSKAIDICVRILSALAALHSAGIVHRDLHAGNIMIERTGAVKITDFGTAKDLAARFSADARTFRPIGGSLVSSYEQLRSPQNVTPSSDLYSVGVLLYRMISLRYPYFVTGDSSIVDLMEAVEAGQYRSIPRITYPAVKGRLAKEVGRLLSNDPGYRGPDAESVADRLRSMLPSYEAVEKRPAWPDLEAHPLLSGPGTQGAAWGSGGGNLVDELAYSYSSRGRYCVYKQAELKVDLEFDVDDSPMVRMWKRDSLEFISRLRKDLEQRSDRLPKRRCPVCGHGGHLEELPNAYHFSCGDKLDRCFFDVSFFKPNLAYESWMNGLKMREGLLDR